MYASIHTVHVINSCHLDIGFADPPGRSFFQLRSEWIGTHCSLPENFEERSCTASMSLADWVQWFFLDHFGTGGMYTLALCAMVTVWSTRPLVSVFSHWAAFSHRWRCVAVLSHQGRSTRRLPTTAGADGT